jgi:N-acetyl sugar amidotransferase
VKIKKNIYLFASQVDSSFVINEILQLSETFENVNVVMQNSDTSNFDFPPNVSIILVDYENYKTSKILKKNFLCYFRILVLEFIKSPKNILKFDILKLNSSRLLRNFYISDCIAELPFFKKDDILYSFWFDDWATALAILKKKNKITDFVSLAHGYDLYEERTSVTYRIAFRWFQFKYVRNVYSVSKKGADYLSLKYPKYSDKIKFSYLQTSYKGQNILNPNTINIVTCANFSAVKRIQLIPEILEYFSVPVVWHYIGDITFETDEAKKFIIQTQEVVKRYPLVQINIIGKMSNAEVFDFYLKNSISALLSVSESEGLPVSMMEAISFGIPIISTDVGGCSEIVNETTGMLIPKKFDPKITAKKIIEFLEFKNDITDYRKGVFEFWSQNFSTNKIKFLQKFNLPSAFVNDKQVCSKCVMDSDSDELITFNKQGICNYCTNYDIQISKLGTDKEKHSFITQKIFEIKTSNKNKKYDCILGVSGGVDSTFLAYWCKQNALNPLVVHFDNGWNSELASKNIENICTILGLELNTFVINWAEFKELQLAYLNAGVIDIEVLTDHAIYATIVAYAKKYKIKYILSGFNLVTEGIMPKGWVYDKLDWKNIKDIYKNFGQNYKIKTFPHLTFLQKLYNHWFSELESIQVLNYINYNKNEAKSLIAKELNWLDYGGKHYESVFTKFYQSYILPVKFKVDKRKAHLSTLLCSGQITKDEAIEEMNKPPFDSNSINNEKEYIVKKLGLTLAEFDEIIFRAPRQHTDFKNEAKLWERYFKIIKFIKFWKN